MALCVLITACSGGNVDESPARAVVLSDTGEKEAVEQPVQEEGADSSQKDEIKEVKDFRLGEGEEFATLNSDIILSTAVEELMPVDTISTFRTYARIYAWAAVNAPRKETIHFNWYGPDDKVILPASYLDVEVNIGPVGYRVFTYRVVRVPGNYRIDMMNSAGSKIGEARFEVVQ